MTRKRAECYCQNCAWEGDEDDTLSIKHLYTRVSPGEPMPCGECPNCGALCQLFVEKKSADPTVVETLAVLDRIRRGTKSLAQVIALEHATRLIRSM